MKGGFEETEVGNGRNISYLNLAIQMHPRKEKESIKNQCWGGKEVWENRDTKHVTQERNKQQGWGNHESFELEVHQDWAMQSGITGRMWIWRWPMFLRISLSAISNSLIDKSLQWTYSRPGPSPLLMVSFLEECWAIRLLSASPHTPPTWHVCKGMLQKP